MFIQERNLLIQFKFAFGTGGKTVARTFLTERERSGLYRVSACDNTSKCFGIWTISERQPIHIQNASYQNQTNIGVLLDFIILLGKCFKCTFQKKSQWTISPSTNDFFSDMFFNTLSERKCPRCLHVIYPLKRPMPVEIAKIKNFGSQKFVLSFSQHKKEESRRIELLI